VKVQPLQNPNLFSHTLNELIQTVRKQRWDLIGEF
jgi:hypothetical protein